MVQIIRKAPLPSASEVPEALAPAAAAATKIRIREMRPVGFPLLFTSELELIEPAIAYLHEHGVQRAHTADTVRTYAEILYDWFETLEQNHIGWADADAADLVAYRNRMLSEPSGHTRRPYSVRTINHRIRGVLRFYEWAVSRGWLRRSSLIDRGTDFQIASGPRAARSAGKEDTDGKLFVLRQFAALPRPLSGPQARELLARLVPPYDLMARWQLYTGLRVSELLRLRVTDVTKTPRGTGATDYPPAQTVEVLRKGRKSGYVIATGTLLEETAGYASTYRRAWLARACHRRGAAEDFHLFIGSRGRVVSRNRYQQVIRRTGVACGFKATSHLLRATFACWMLARLEQLAKRGAAINPLLIVKVLMGHEHINTTDRYLRAIAVDSCVLTEVLDSLIFGVEG
jgi:site-specific recombinase XerD